MRIAVIDLGTNSVRFDVHQISKGNRVRLLHREKLMIRLGQGVFLDGKLDPNAIRRAIQAFTSFKRTATILQANKIVAFGTSALREAADSERLLERIRAKTGIDVRVISGDEEAKLIAQGILSNEPGIKGRFGLIDIGGGSTEINICRGGEVISAASFPLGTARLQQVFLKSSPPKAEKKGEVNPVSSLRRYIKSVLLPKMIAEDWTKVRAVIGSSGTIRALMRIHRKISGSDILDRKSLAKLVNMMTDMTTTQLLGVPGMEAKRVDMILAGAILLEECMEATGASDLVATNYSLRDGILAREIEVIHHQKGSEIGFQISDLYERAKKLGGNEEHLKRVVHFCDTLFDRLKTLHRLRSQWKFYLDAAAILHDTGQAISPTHHEQHSFYIVQNADFPSMEKWETDFIAQLCLLHNGGKISKKELTFAKDKVERQAFIKLLAILRVADALDRSHQSNIRIRKVTLERGRVRITLASRKEADLEILRVEQKKALFEEVFGRELVVD